MYNTSKCMHFLLVGKLYLIIICIIFDHIISSQTKKKKKKCWITFSPFIGTQIFNEMIHETNSISLSSDFTKLANYF